MKIRQDKTRQAYNRDRAIKEVGYKRFMGYPYSGGEIVEMLGTEEFYKFTYSNLEENRLEMPLYWLIAYPKSRGLPPAAPIDGLSFGVPGHRYPSIIRNYLKSEADNDPELAKDIKTHFGALTVRLVVEKQLPFYGALEVTKGVSISDTRLKTNLFMPTDLVDNIPNIAEGKKQGAILAGNNYGDFIEYASHDEYRFDVAKSLGLSALYYAGVSLNKLPKGGDVYGEIHY